MKNIILQHWCGDLQEINKLSKNNIEKYAEFCGAEYRFLEGNVFNDKLCPYLQKLYMLDECFDDYDIVVMLDMDMFARKGETRNVFVDASGYGVCDAGNEKNFLTKFKGSFKKYYYPNSPFWGGSIYRLDKSIRVKLREQLPNISKSNWNDMNRRDWLADEGIMHVLAAKAGIPKEGSLMEEIWSKGHFVSNINDVAIIHMRNRIRLPDGTRLEKATKEENYRALAERGIL